MRRLCIQWLLAALAVAAPAEQRVALVLANSAYPKAPLGSPPNDARTVAEALTKAGFTVTQAENFTRESFRSVLDAFIRSVPTRGTALIYFAGHSFAIGKADTATADNVLLPINVNPVTPAQLAELESAATRVLTRLAKESGSALNILIVDGACAHAGQAPQSPRGHFKTGTVPPESILIHAVAPGENRQPAERLSPIAEKFAAGLNSGPELDKILVGLTPHHESSLAAWPALGSATRPVAPADKLIPGSKPGDEWVNAIGTVFCWCPPGTFTMGSPLAEPQRQADESPVSVTFKTGFWMGKHEFTRREVITLKKQGVYLSTGDHKLHPINKSRWDDAGIPGWVKRLNETAPAGWEYAVPTEAEWEYAARAGTQTAYSFGDDPARLAKFGNFADQFLRDGNAYGENALNFKLENPTFRRDRETGLFTYAHRTWNDGFATMAPVGSFPPNAWGLHDVHGNLAELTSTPYHRDRTPPEKFDEREGYVCKGGSWLSTADYCRAAFRGQFTFRSRENTTENYLGLRLVLRPKAKP